YLGTPQVFAAHTRGYLFDIEKGLPVALDWGALVTVFQNLPDGYGLLPSRAYMELINPDAPMQTDWTLTDLYGNRLREYDAVFNFLTGAKVDPESKPLGLGRNGTMWAQQQEDLHGRMNDWREYDGPPQVFRQVGRVAASTTLSWSTATGFDVSVLANSSRREAGDTDVHVLYREALQPQLGWGDGTVALVSATLGGGETPAGRSVGRKDYSGQKTTWITPFEYFPCLHVGMVEPSCRGKTGSALERTVEVLKSSYEYVPRPAGKDAASDDQFAEGERETFYIQSSSPIRVTVENEFGSQTGPRPGQPLNKVRYDISDIGYWASFTNAVLSLPSENEYSVTIQAAEGDAVVRVSRGQTEGDEVRNIFFGDHLLSDGGSIRMTLPAGGTSNDTAFEVDADGDGSFEAASPPRAEMMSSNPGPSIPSPSPSIIRVDIDQSSADPTVSVELPDVGGPVWDWALKDAPGWITADAVAGQNPATIGLTFAASTLSAGLHRDRIVLAVTFDGFTTRFRIPVELAIRDQAAFVTGIE
ncbi:MAG: hypothetical protein ACC655_11915, partial [Rhodothermia bacterium]